MTDHDDHPETVDLAQQRALTRQYAAELAETDPDTIATLADGLGITETWLLEQMQDIATGAMEGVPIFDKQGDYAGHAPQYVAATKALELLMRSRGMFTDRTETNVTGGIDIRIVGVNTETLT